jgi:nitrogen fixation/metabolism regulation signal transduction histidine kinase
VRDLESELIALPGDAGNINYSDGVKNYLSLIDYSENTFISKISVDKSLILLGGYKVGSILSVFYRVVPEKFYSRVAYFAHAKKRYDQKIFLRPYIQSFTGLMLFVLSLGVVVIAIGISLLLSKNITKPVLELEESARQVAAGDFSIRLYRTASDELTLLYDSFNTMVRQLNESRKAMFHMQKIKAWGEVGNKLLHEIKNPLTPIKLSAERMRKRFVEKHENIDKIILNGTDTIIEEVASLQHILAEFSQFARLPKVKLSKHNINSIVKNCINMFLGHDNINFICGYDETLPEIMVDKILLRQSLVNILKNALEAVKDTGEIEVNTGKNDDNYLFIAIKDNGHGISSEDIEKLFEPTFSKKENGNGLGLAIVEKIIVEHKGRITCQSKENEGSLFTIELPIDN